ncbi:hypothetical protein NQ318_001051, partial [Aromia moschata]
AVNADLPKITEFVVKTTVANRFAETNVLSRVENIDKYAKQSTFSVVLPENAFISGFFMEINNKTYKAFVLEKEEAKKIYTQSVSSGTTAAHVSVSTRNSNRFTINVNVEPESKVSFHLAYEELLQREKGQYEIIANIQPGQIVKKLRVEVKIKESRPLLFVRTPELRSGSGKIQNNVNLDPHAVVDIKNTSAVVTFRPDVNRQLQFACAGLGNTEYDGFAGQFVVEYDVERDPQGGETLFQDGFFINFFAPSNLEPIPKHIVFVLDTSGSMAGEKITQLKEAMSSILPQLYPDDLFSIVQYEAEVYLWDSNGQSFKAIPPSPQYGQLASQLQNTPIPDPLGGSKENIEKITNIVNNMLANGGTNTIAALEIGLYVVKKVQETYKDPYQPILVFMTDGQPNVGIAETDRIIDLVTSINSREYKVPINTVCIGSDADFTFLQKLSLATDAKPKKIYVDGSPNSDVAGQLQDYYQKYLSTPVLSNVTFNNLPLSAQLTKIHFPVFFNGTEITIAGKGASANGSNPITISARGKQGPLELEAKLGIPLTKLERVWAYLTVKQLLEEFQATSSQSNKTELSKLVLDIALKYSLVTDMTSLIVVKPNDTNSAVNVQDASTGIFPASPNELPMCNNITNWIITNFGTPEPTTTEVTTTLEPTTTEPTTTTEPSTKTTETPTTTMAPTTLQPTTTEVDIGFIGESEIGITGLPTTTEEPTTTTERVKTCNETIFGCCHDRITPANGPNFLGCDPIPKSDALSSSESCSLPQDSGRCSNYTMKWRYDTIQGICSEFWYTGCGGNGNRFKSKDVCEKTCVNPTGPNICHLPIVLGNCARFDIKWFYDKKKNECNKYMYSGCGGNSNRFDTKMECLQLCGPRNQSVSVQELRSSLITEYTMKTMLPKQMVADDYPTLRFEAYTLYHQTRQLRACREVQSREEKISLITFYENPMLVSFQKMVVLADGLKSTFISIERTVYADNSGMEAVEVMKTVSKHKATATEFVYILQDKVDVCRLPHVKGPCKQTIRRWYYDRNSKTCTPFDYGGCHGNNNNFKTREECFANCLNGSAVDLQESCFLKEDKGPCSQFTLKWSFNRKLAKCKQFWYGGCGGNNNRFTSEATCNDICINPRGKVVHRVTIIHQILKEHERLNNVLKSYSEARKEATSFKNKVTKLKKNASHLFDIASFVIEASLEVCGAAARDGFIRTRLWDRKLMQNFETKRDYKPELKANCYVAVIFPKYRDRVMETTPGGITTKIRRNVENLYTVDASETVTTSSRQMNVISCASDCVMSWI